MYGFSYNWMYVYFDTLDTFLPCDTHHATSVSPTKEANPKFVDFRILPKKSGRGVHAFPLNSSEI